MLGLEHVGELLNEIHDEFPLVAIQSIERICDHRELVVRPFRSSLQQLIYRAFQRVAELLEPMQGRYARSPFPPADRFLFQVDQFRQLGLCKTECSPSLCDGGSDAGGKQRVLVVVSGRGGTCSHRTIWWSSFRLR